MRRDGTIKEKKTRKEKKRDKLLNKVSIAVKRKRNATLVPKFITTRGVPEVVGREQISRILWVGIHVGWRCMGASKHGVVIRWR